MILGAHGTLGLTHFIWLGKRQLMSFIVLFFSLFYFKKYPARGLGRSQYTNAALLGTTPPISNMCFCSPTLDQNDLAWTTSTWQGDSLYLWGH